MRPANPASKIRSEILTHERLSTGLDDTWTVFANVHFPDDHGFYSTVPERPDIDFLACHPDKGVMIIEVKGNTVDDIDTHPRTGDRDIKQQLIGQRQSFCKFLDAARIEVRPEDVPIVLVARHDSTMQDSLGEGRISGLDGNARWIRPRDAKHLVDFLMNSTAQRLPWMDSIPSLLERNFHADEAKQQTMPWELSDRAQKDAKGSDTDVPKRALAETRLAEFRDAQAINRMLVGVAGSGKTQIILQEAERLAVDKRQKILVTCWNLHLKAGLKSRIQKSTVEQITSRVIVHHADGLLEAFAAANNIDLPEPAGTKAYYDALHEAFRDGENLKLKIPKDLQNLTCIMVDEAQDLGNPQWGIIRRLANAGRVPVLVA